LMKGKFPPTKKARRKEKAVPNSGACRVNFRLKGGRGARGKGLGKAKKRKNAPSGPQFNLPVESKGMSWGGGVMEERTKSGLTSEVIPQKNWQGGGGGKLKLERSTKGKKTPS